MLKKFHRIPIWEYRTDQQLLKGVLDALAAHKALCDEGLLHGRISPETVFLVETATEQDFAGFLDATHAEEVVKGPSDHGFVLSGLPGTMSRNMSDFAAPLANGMCALRFMSRRLLWHLSQGRTSIQTEVEDDVESFYWVLLYAVFRKLVTNMDSVAKSRAEGKLIRTSFLKMFGGTSAKEILDGRASALQAIEADDLFMTDVAADRISHALRVLLWHYNTTHLRNTAVKSHRPRAQGIKDHKPRPSTKALAKVFNHKDLMSDLDVAAAGGLLGTDDSDMSVDD